MDSDAPVPAAERRRHVLLLAATAAIVLVLDQLTKSWALRALADSPIGDGLFRFVLSFNRGAAFGLGQGLTPFLVAGGMVLLGVLIAMGRTVPGPVGATAIGLVLGGSVGNLADRLFRPFDGAVVDFIDIGAWPVFNVADIGITCGAVLLVLSTWERPRRDDAAVESATPAGDA